MNLGDCIRTAIPGNPIPHCWFVVAVNDKGECVIVNMTTLSHICDKTVVLRAGDHPEVTHDSIILYIDARIVSLQNLDLLVSRGIAQRKAPCGPELLAKLVKGISDSPNTEPKILSFCGLVQTTTVNPAPRRKP